MQRVSSVRDEYRPSFEWNKHIILYVPTVIRGTRQRMKCLLKLKIVIVRSITAKRFYSFENPPATERRRFVLFVCSRSLVVELKPQFPSTIVSEHAVSDR